MRYNCNKINKLDCLEIPMYLFFFFQAEDGIRDLTVTGVQTCALPILAEDRSCRVGADENQGAGKRAGCLQDVTDEDRKSTRLNSSHSQISYAVFCLKKNKHTTAPAPKFD